MIKCLAKIYGNIKFKRGTKHEYLGMDVDYGNQTEVKVSMIQYLEKIIENFPEV